MPKQTRAKRKASGTTRRPAVPKKKSIVATAVRTSKEEQAAPRPPLPAAWQIAWRAARMLWLFRRFFLLLAAIYLLLDLLLVRSVVAFDVSTLWNKLGDSLKHGAGIALGGLSVFSSLFTAAASGASADATGAYHFFLILIMSLVTIWAFRQIFAGNQISLGIKRAFYDSTTPLVPFLLLMFLMGLQFVPLFIVLEVYSIVLSGGIIHAAVEQVFFVLLLIGAIALTLFWLSRTIIALYIVTLPDMEPLQAYQKAKVLVHGRRLSIIRKLVFLPVACFVIAGIIIVPCILIWAPLAQWLFFILTGAGFIAIHAYLYTLYRELLA